MEERGGNRLQMGVYRMYDPRTGKSILGASRNVTGTLKRLRFELTLNACPHAALRRLYEESGGDVRFELVEAYEPNDSLSEEEIDAHLAALMLRHRERLGAQLLR